RPPQPLTTPRLAGPDPNAAAAGPNAASRRRRGEDQPPTPPTCAPPARPTEAPAREAMTLDTLSQPRAAARRSRRAERRIRRPAPLRCPGGEAPPPTPPTCAPPARPTEAPAREAVNSEQKAGQGAAGLGDPRVAGREHLEQPDQVQPDLVPVLAGGAPDNAEQPVERLFGVAQGHLDVRNADLGVRVGGVGRRVPAGLGLVVGGHPPEQVYLGQAHRGHRVAGLPRQQPLEGAGRGVEITSFHGLLRVGQLWLTQSVLAGQLAGLRGVAVPLALRGLVAGPGEAKLVADLD